MIFEVWPAEGQRDTYLEIAAALRPLLDEIDGFISVEASKASTNRARCCRFRSGGMRMPCANGAPWMNTGAPNGPDGIMSSATTGCESRT